MESIPQAPSSDVTPQAPPALRFSHHGNPRELLAISMVNLLLRIVTVGVYHFWAKTRVRAYVWSQTAMNGERFEYTGLGREMFFGYLIAMLVVAPLFGAWQFGMPLLVQEQPMLIFPLMLIFYTLLAFLMGFGKYSSMRYLSSRTRWRGIRFALTGSATHYAFNTLKYAALSMLTLGFLYPMMQVRQGSRLLSGFTFGGSIRLRTQAPLRPLMDSYVLFLSFLFGVFTVLFGGIVGVAVLVKDKLNPEAFGFGFAGVYLLLFPLIYTAYLWYNAGVARHLAASTRVEADGGEAATVRLSFTKRQYIGLNLGNLLRLVFTLGLAYPWVVVRTANFICAHLHVEGVLNLEVVAQSAAPAPRTGEGLAEAFDLGSI